jgi:hypothetical protein
MIQKNEVVGDKGKLIRSKEKLPGNNLSAGSSLEPEVCIG